jgi:uncharacterized repeat protein (TIGR03803 family)
MPDLRRLQNAAVPTGATTMAYLILMGVALLLAAGTAVQAQTFSVIHNFTGVGGDGANPDAGVTVRAGMIYGTTCCGGNGNHGTVYQITRVGANWVAMPISLFSNGGFNPIARVVFGPDGHPYGTTSDSPAGPGRVFDLIVPLTICKTANCFWKENVLYEFRGGSDGAYPGYGDLVWDQQGNIYGTTTAGGGSNFGTVYELTPAGNSYSESVLYSFSGADGETPLGGAIVDTSGNVLGTTLSGGANGAGTIFKLTKQGSEWFESTLYSLQGAVDGSGPYAGLVLDSLGNLYGTTSSGGTGHGGTVFELIRSGDSYTFKVLYSFPSASGCGPFASLTLDGAGSLYDTTRCGGANNLGAVFELTNTGNGWTYTSLHDFTGNDGAYPISNVAIDANGNLYGTASTGGSQNLGVVWMIAP